MKAIIDNILLRTSSETTPLEYFLLIVLLELLKYHVHITSTRLHDLMERIERIERAVAEARTDDFKTVIYELHRCIQIS